MRCEKCGLGLLPTARIRSALPPRPFVLASPEERIALSILFPTELRPCRH
jgi:hypothetical protein